MNREERLAEEYARNPCCKECSSPTTKEVRSGVEETYEYVCSDDYCETVMFKNEVLRTFGYKTVIERNG